ncbi:MaoC family dehydratase N-terminal domain-containing protein [Streptomyces sp. NPDC057580]|uniref:FAS1-like dehydratase domain-containing protein n=1 Tax=Streptomyces sp. NPDC057580 TaxID=3346173 RepID=UPI0036C8677F
MTDQLSAAMAAVREQLGRPVTRPLGPVSERTAQRFAIATSDDSQVYFDRDAARDAGYPDLPVPPLYLSSVREWGAGPAPEELQPDGTTTTDVGLPTGVPVRVLGGGQTLAFADEIVVGVPVTAEFTVTDVRRRPGTAGDLLVVEVRRTYTDVDGRTLLDCTESRVLR